MIRKNALCLALLALCFLSLAVAPEVKAKSNIVITKHNLSVTGPGEIRALTETRVCVFCHTPHNSSPLTPLWNRELKPVNYTLYSSSTMQAHIEQPTGASRLCLSCHDGTVALGRLISVKNEVPLTGQITAARSSFLGTDISNDHPVSFSYYDSLPNVELRPEPPTDLRIYEGGMIHCSTCHDAHDNTFGSFLAVDNQNSALCTRCHVLRGWPMATHGTSGNMWTGRGMDPWPHTPYDTVARNGCENCHKPHNAGGAKRIMNYRREEDNCYSCHTGNVAAKNILSETTKVSKHPPQLATIGISADAHDPVENPLTIRGHVECQDCHNPHRSNSSATAVAPDVSGMLVGVPGVTLYGAALPEARYEYEICLKCHADSNPLPSTFQRVINETNMRRKFLTTNPSYHPVAAVGRNRNDVPSIPTITTPGMSTSSRIYCMDCHDSDASPAVGKTGPRGPHGSRYKPLLRQQYQLAGGNESALAYALCYGCHDRNSILNNESFQTRSGGGGHNGHLLGAAKASCSVCHDPHGVPDDGRSGSHTHLINFDTLLVSPAAGYPAPIFIDRGSRTGSCVLVCHGKNHTSSNSVYP